MKINILRGDLTTYRLKKTTGAGSLHPAVVCPFPYRPDMDKESLSRCKVYGDTSRPVTGADMILVMNLDDQEKCGEFTLAFASVLSYHFPASHEVSRAFILANILYSLVLYKHSC